MRITKQQLQQIIREELTLSENKDTYAATQTASTAVSAIQDAHDALEKLEKLIAKMPSTTSTRSARTEWKHASKSTLDALHSIKRLAKDMDRVHGETGGDR